MTILSLQNQFQHSELVAKKEKITRLEEVMDEETSSRDATVRLAREAVQKRRTKIATQDKPDLVPNDKSKPWKRNSKKNASFPKCLVWSNKRQQPLPWKQLTCIVPPSLLPKLLQATRNSLGKRRHGRESCSFHGTVKGIHSCNWKSDCSSCTVIRTHSVYIQASYGSGNGANCSVNIHITR